MTSRIIVEPLGNDGSLVSAKRRTGVYHAAVNNIAEPNFTDDGPNKVVDPFDVEIQSLPFSGMSGAVYGLNQQDIQPDYYTLPLNTHPVAEATPSNTKASFAPSPLVVNSPESFIETEPVETDTVETDSED